MGSVELSPTMQVLDTAGKVIEGLYAAGEVANCVHGDDSAPAANVAWVATSAKLASDEAVKFAKESAAKDATENAAKDAPQEAKEAASGK